MWVLSTAVKKVVLHMCRNYKWCLLSIIHTFFKIFIIIIIKIVFFLTFFYYFPPTPYFFFLWKHPLLLLLVLISISASLSSPFFFFFLRIFFVPLLLLQFGFYTFIIDDDFGLGLIKGSDFGQRKQKFWVEKMVILGWSAVSASLQHLLLSFFLFSFFFFQFRFDCLYEFVYGFDEFGSRFRTILMILWCVRVVVMVVGGTGLQWWRLAMLGCYDDQLLGIEEWVRESLTRQERGERKNIK